MDLFRELIGFLRRIIVICIPVAILYLVQCLLHLEGFTKFIFIYVPAGLWLLGMIPLLFDAEPIEIL